MNLLVNFFLVFLVTKLYALDEREQFMLTNNYALILEIFIFIAIIVAVIIYKQYTMNKLNTQLNLKVEKEIQKSREKDKMIFEQSKFISMGEMMENIAHQWRQPLSQINSSVLVIDDIMYEKDFKNSTIEEKLLEIESLTKYMSNTINDFKDFFDQNKKSEKFSLHELIEKSIYIVKGTYKANNIEIINDTDKSYMYQGYPSELQQVIVVILNNAKDMFINRNIFKPKVTIKIDSSSQYYNILIYDNAGGIKNKIIDKIFDPYFTTKHKSQGTGLGLYLSKKIIEESMHGKLEAQNHKKGACFNIILEKDTNE